MISKIAPIMQKALRDSKPLRYFGEVWLSVLNDTVDSQADFQASKRQSNMDFTTKPGYAELGKQDASVNQATGATFLKIFGDLEQREAWQSITLPGGRWLSSFTVWPRITPQTVATEVKFSIYASDQSTALHVHDAVFPVGSTYDAEYTISLTDFYLDAGLYWLKMEWGIGGFTSYAGIKYNSSDVYADGQLDAKDMVAGLWSYNIGDLYFKLNMQKYLPSGHFRTKRLDLGEAPVEPGTFQMAYSHPQDTLLSVTLEGFADAVTGTPAVSYADVADGRDLPAGIRYWEAYVQMSSNSALDRTPQIDMIEIMFGKDRLLLTEEGSPLRHADAAAFADYRAMLRPLEFKSSDIKLLDRVASGGEISTTLVDPTGDTLQRVISDSPLLNYRGVLYLGADVPGFRPEHLLRFFVGTVQGAKYKPKYRRPAAELSLTFKNPILELTRKVPMPATTGAVTLADISINYDGTHSVAAMLDLTRGEADTPARYLSLESFEAGRLFVGPAFVVRRSNAAGLPDTRLKNPEEVRKHLAALCIIADGYITEDEDSRITFVPHNAAAAPEAVWADEEYVRAGVDAIPIEDVGEMDMGYESLLYNAALLAAEWDGAGGDWTNFGKLYAHVDADSMDDFAPGRAVFMRMMEKNMVEVSKWLGPQAGYNGETIAQTITARLTARYAYPPVVMKGVVVPNSEFMRTKGSAVQIWSREFCRFRRRGIALSETMKFMVLSKKIDRARNRMIFDLVELT